MAHWENNDNLNMIKQLTLCQHARNIYVPRVLFGIPYHEMDVPSSPMIYDNMRCSNKSYKLLYMLYEERKNMT